MTVIAEHRYDNTRTHDVACSYHVVSILGMPFERGLRVKRGTAREGIRGRVMWRGENGAARDGGGVQL